MLNMPPSKKIRIKDIASGSLGTDETGAFFIEAGGQRIYKVRILGTVIHKYISADGKYGAITIDDGSDTIRCKAFANNMDIIKKHDVGSVCDIIGKIKSWNDEIYIVPEIILAVDDPNLETLRNLEIAKEIRKKGGFVNDNKKGENNQDISKDDKKDAENLKKKMIGIIIGEDSGNGAEYEAVIEKSGMDAKAAEEILKELLYEGTCYEPRSGKIKVL